MFHIWLSCLDLIVKCIGEEAKYESIRLLFDGLQQPVLNKQVKIIKGGWLVLARFCERHTVGFWYVIVKWHSQGGALQTFGQKKNVSSLLLFFTDYFLIFLIKFSILIPV